MAQHMIEWMQSIREDRPGWFAISKSIPGESVARVSPEGDRWRWQADGQEGLADTLDEAQDEAGRRALRFVSRTAEGKAAE